MPVGDQYLNSTLKFFANFQAFFLNRKNRYPCNKTFINLRYRVKIQSQNQETQHKSKLSTFTSVPQTYFAFILYKQFLYTSPADSSVP